MNPPLRASDAFRSHIHAVVGLAERIVAEANDPLAAELATAICHQTRFLLDDESMAEDRSSGGVSSAPQPDDEPSLEGIVDPSILATLAEEIGSPEIVVTLVDTFLGELDERISSLVNAAADRGEEACRAAHTLKGTASTMGAVELTDLSAGLELIFRNGEGEPEPMLTQLPGAGDRCRAALNKVVRDMEVAT